MNDVGWFRGATALIAVHVVNDAVVSIPAGASRADQAPGASIAIAVALLAAWAYPRLRPVLRGWLGIAFGALALTRGVIAAYEVSEVGATGEDPTALLLLPAGAALVATGVFVLWRGRSRAGSLGRRVARRTLVGVAAGAFFFVFVAGIATGLVYLDKPRTEVPAAELGRPYREVTLHTEDGLDLAAWYVPSRNGAAVIAFPGRTEPVGHARMLARHGYGVLLLDVRGTGESDGSFQGLWDSTDDLDAAVDFLSTRPDVDPSRIGGIGLSQGGEQLLQFAAEDERLHAIVADGPGSRSVREAVHQPGLRLGLPMYAVFTATYATLSGHAPPPPLRAVVSRISPRPVFFVYAGRGAGGEEMTPDYAARFHGPKQLWKIPEASHTGGLEARPAEYERRVVAFFDRSLAR